MVEGIYSFKKRNSKFYSEREILSAGSDVAISLLTLGRYGEAKSMLREQIRVARRICGPLHETTLGLMNNLVVSIFAQKESGLEDMKSALPMLEQILCHKRQTLGESHPETINAKKNLETARHRIEQGRTPENSTRVRCV